MTTAAQSTALPTLLDQIKRMDPDGSVATIVELLSRRTPILEDAVFLEGNLPTGHRVTSQLGLPSVGWRRFNEGVASSKMRTAQWDEQCGMLDALSVVDCALADLNGNAPAFRASEDKGFMTAIAKELDSALVYSSTKTDPEKILGLAPRFNSTTDTGGSQIQLSGISSSGSDQTSVWFVVWGPDTVFGVYPKGSVGGVQSVDMGVQLWEDANGNRFRAYVTNWCVKLGLVVKDYRYVVRVPNIDTSAIAATGSLLVQDLIKAFYKLPTDATRMGRVAMYCNNTVATYLHLQSLDTAKNGTVTVENVAGQGRVMSFLGVPIRITDSILNTESIIS